MRSVYAAELGRLMYLRVVGQNAVIVNFPIPIRARHARSTCRWCTAAASSRRSSIAKPSSLDQEQEPVLLQPEPRYIYSNRSYWYPQ